MKSQGLCPRGKGRIAWLVPKQISNEFNTVSNIFINLFEEHSFPHAALVPPVRRLFCTMFAQPGGYFLLEITFVFVRLCALGCVWVACCHCCSHDAGKVFITRYTSALSFPVVILGCLGWTSHCLPCESLKKMLLSSISLVCCASYAY